MSSVTVSSITADLLAEQAALDSVVSGLSDDQWELPTPSPGWSVRDQIGHLAYFDGTAAMAIVDPDGFSSYRDDFTGQRFNDASAADRVTLGASRAMSASELLAHWRSNRDALAAAASQCNDDDRIEWYGPSMGAKSFLTARLMECWAHGQDICDTVGATREPTDRLRHIAQLGYITRGWTYLNRKLEVPEGTVRVRLDSPNGDVWEWGPNDGTEPEGVVTGTAVDFCLVTTQRRNIADTALDVHGNVAVDWLGKAQLFAGPPSDPPPPQG